MCGHSDPFRTVRDLGLVSPGCPGGSGSSEGCSSAWLPAWLPAVRPAGTTNGFQNVRNSLPDSVTTWAVGGRAHHVTQNHPVCISRVISTWSSKVSASVACPWLIHRRGRTALTRATSNGCADCGPRARACWDQQHFRREVFPPERETVVAKLGLSLRGAMWDY